MSFSATDLKALEGVRFVGLGQQPEVYDLRHHFSEPAQLGIDRMEYTLSVATGSGEQMKFTARAGEAQRVERPKRGLWLVARPFE